MSRIQDRNSIVHQRGFIIPGYAVNEKAKNPRCFSSTCLLFCCCEYLEPFKPFQRADFHVPESGIRAQLWPLIESDAVLTVVQDMLLPIIIHPFKGRYASLFHCEHKFPRAGKIIEDGLQSSPPKDSQEVPNLAWSELWTFPDRKYVHRFLRNRFQGFFGIFWEMIR